MLYTVKRRRASAAPPMPFRFWDKVTIGDGCWEWQASCDKQGYGQFQLGGTMRKAHRVAWELWNDQIPEGMCVCHRCDNPRCVKPDHLFLGTPRDNARDRDSKGRHYMKDVCAAGHPLVPWNGQRRCLVCLAAYKQRKAQVA